MDERMMHEPTVRESDVVAAWVRAQLAEVVVRSDGGSVTAATVVPLVDGGLPCLALSYDRLALAHSIAAADEVVLAVTAFARGGTAGTVRVRAELAEDHDGGVFTSSGLLDQELAKYPPSRRRVDSPLLRREHWWCVPRLIVRFRDLADGRGVEASDGLVAVAGDHLVVGTCGIVGREAGELRLRVDGLPDGNAVVFEHGADVPDLERPWYRRWHGRLRGSLLAVERNDQQLAPDRPLGLVDRWRVERALERNCRAGLRRAGVR